MKYDRKCREILVRSSKDANLLAHEEAFAAVMPAQAGKRPAKSRTNKLKSAAVDRAAVAKLLSVFEDDVHRSDSLGEEEEEEAAIGSMVLDAVGSPPESRVPSAAAARSASVIAANGVLEETLAGAAAAGTSSGSACAAGCTLPAARADSAGCFDLGVLIREALERYKHEKDERLLRQRLAEWVSVSRASSLTVAEVDEIGEALAAVAGAAGELGRADSDDDGDSFVLV